MCTGNLLGQPRTAMRYAGGSDKVALPVSGRVILRCEQASAAAIRIGMAVRRSRADRAGVAPDGHVTTSVRRARRGTFGHDCQPRASIPAGATPATWLRPYRSPRIPAHG